MVGSADQRQPIAKCGRQLRSEAMILREQPMWSDLDGWYGAHVPVSQMDIFIVILPDGTMKEVGRHTLQGLGVCTYLRAVGFDPHTFWLRGGMRPLRSGVIPSFPSGFRLAIILRVHGGMEVNAGGNGGSHVLVEPRLPFATYLMGNTHAQWQQAVDTRELLWTKIDVESRIDALGDNKGQWLNRFMLHHGIDNRSTG